MGEKKTKLMLYSTLVEIEVEVGVELGNLGSFVRVEIRYKPEIRGKTYKDIPELGLKYA